MKSSLLLTLAGILTSLAAVSVFFQLLATMGKVEWEAGREAGLIEGVVVFGFGGALLAFFTLIGMAGLVWGRRGPRSAFWLSIVPGFMGLLVACAVAVALALNEGEEGEMAVIVPAAFAVGPLFLFLGGLIARRLSKAALHRQSDPQSAAQNSGS